jgi:hypothetical protein
MGGVFLGNTEWSAGLRDGRIYARGDDKELIKKEVEESVKKVRETVFRVHNL